MQLPPIQVASVEIGVLGSTDALQTWFNDNPSVNIVSINMNETYCYIFYTE